MGFKDNLQYLRGSHNMTQEQLAMLIGVSRQSVSKWESEKAYPEMDKLLMLCDMFGVSLDYLVMGDVRNGIAMSANHVEDGLPKAPMPEMEGSALPQDITGYESLCYMRYDDPELYADLFERMGRLQCEIWERFLKRYSDAYCVLRFGDDLGFNTSTLLPAPDVIKYVVPQYRRITDMVHATGRPFLLHSCGNIFSVFDALIDKGRIDAKHSNEDGIAHFSVWVEKYGDRIGNFGGIDTDVLCRQSEDYIRKYVFDCLERTRNGGGMAFGSGNSIPDYVPTAGYLAMVNAVREWRGDYRD